MQAAIDRTQELADSETAPPFLLQRLAGELAIRNEEVSLRLAEVDSHFTEVDDTHRAHDRTYRALRREVLRAETARLSRLLADGDVGEVGGDGCNATSTWATHR